MNNLNNINVIILAMISFLGIIAIFVLSFYYPKSKFYPKTKNTHLYGNNFSNYINYSFLSTNHTLNIFIKDDNNTYTDIKGFHDSSLINK